MADDYSDDDLPADNMAGLANGMIILTSVVLIVAIFAMLKLCADHYQVGLLS